MKLEITKRADAPQDKRALLPFHYEFKLDGNDISDSLTKLQLGVDVGDANRVVLTMLIDDMEIDVDAMLELKANLDAKREGDVRTDVDVAGPGPVAAPEAPVCGALQDAGPGKVGYKCSLPRFHSGRHIARDDAGHEYDRW